MRGTWAVLAAVVLSGCAWAPSPAPLSDETQNRAGELVLQRPLTIPAHRGWVYIQGGQVYDSPGYISFQAVDQYYTYCRLELRRRSDHSLVVQPGRFRIVDVRRGEELVQRAPLQVAATELRLASAGGAAVAQRIFHLHSDAEPRIARLYCAHWDDPWSAEPPSIAQIQRTLGEIMTLQPPS